MKECLNVELLNGDLKIIEGLGMGKCRYCSKERKSNFEFCNNECENSYKKRIEKDRHKIKYFMLGIILGFFVMFYGAISNRDFVIGAGIVVTGIDIVSLPFTTPETTAFLGYQKSKLVGRILGILLIVVGIWVGCSGQNEISKINPAFQATVLEVHEKSVLVEPLEGEEIRKSADKISVSLDLVSTKEVPKLEEGTRVSIVYNGDVQESYPAKIKTVFAIYLVDANGEVIREIE
nr:hypothetical protein [uncultured Faecalimonas sp.]